MKNIVVMGSTGSIGIQSLDVISKNNSHKVIGLTCHSNADLLFEQTKKYSPDFVAIDVIDSSHNLFNLCEKNNIELITGNDASSNIPFSNLDLAINAIVGTSGLRPTVELIKNGVDVALSNKESLVLGGGAPIYEREYVEPEYYSRYKEFNISSVLPPENIIDVAKQIIKLPNIASKKWIYEQYDSMVGTVNMSTNSRSDAAIVNLKNTNKALALTVDCNARYVNADPKTGCAIAVSEAARNIICSGGEPLAITNCLNFGNPYDPEVYWQFVNSIKGMKIACEALNTPVTGGNVSFYNQTLLKGQTTPCFPTPTIGMIGVVSDKENVMTLGFKDEGDLIYLIGKCYDDISSSEYLANYLNISDSPAPFFDLDEEIKLQKIILDLIKNRKIKSAHDVSDGGLYTCLVESGIASNFGFDILTNHDFRQDAYLFGESQSRVVVTIKPNDQQKFESYLA